MNSACSRLVLLVCPLVSVLAIVACTKQATAPSDRTQGASESSPQAAGQKPTAAELQSVRTDARIAQIIDDLAGSSGRAVWDATVVRVNAELSQRAVELPVHGTSGSMTVGLSDGMPYVILPTEMSTVAPRSLQPLLAQNAVIGPATCDPKVCDYQKRLTLHWACVKWDDNPFGYAVVRQRRYGYTRCTRPHSPSWYANRCGGIAVCPGVETYSFEYTVCGIPQFCTP